MLNTETYTDTRSERTKPMRLAVDRQDNVIVLTDDDYEKCNRLRYDEPFSVRDGRYLLVTNTMCEEVYLVDLGNATQEDIMELSVYVSTDYVFIESNLRRLFGTKEEVKHPIRVTFEKNKEEYIDTLLKEWNKAKKKGRTFQEVKAKQPKKQSKHKRITVSILKECAKFRDEGKSWQDILTTMREYDPVQLKTKGMAFIAKSSL